MSINISWRHSVTEGEAREKGGGVPEQRNANLDAANLDAANLSDANLDGVSLLHTNSFSYLFFLQALLFIGY